MRGMHERRRDRLRCAGLAVAAALGGVAACKREAPAAALAGSAAGAPVAAAADAGRWYRAQLTYDDVGELPFFVRLPPVGTRGPALVQNGSETVTLTASWRGDQLTVETPWNYPSQIAATRDPRTQALTGTWTRETPLWGKVVRAFVAEPIGAPDPRVRFPAGPAPEASVAGTWRMEFNVYHGGKASFEQDADGVVRGTLRPGELGDIRFLAGNLRGRRLALSTFNGNAANLVLATLSPDGRTMSGIMSLQNMWNETFTAEKVDRVALPPRVHLRAGAQTLQLKGLERFRGKPTVVTLFATWCPSCNDMFDFLVELYPQVHRRGLALYGVAYDLSADEAANQAELAFFRKEHGVDWALEQVPCTPETWAKVMPPELEDWDGVPVNLFVRADGTVQSIRGGWYGPAAPADNRELRAWFTAEVDRLLASAAPAPR